MEQYRRSALYSNVESNQVRVMDASIAAGAKVDADANKRFRLYCRLDKNYDYVVKILKLAGAEFDVEASGRSPIFCSVTKNQVDIMEVLLAAVDKGRNLLHCSVENNYVDVVKALIASGANVNAVEYGCTPLYRSVERNHTDIVKALIAAGANVEAKVNGHTPLYCSIDNSNLNIVKALIDGGADVNVKTFHCPTPLYRSVQIHRVDVVKALIAAGADVEAASFGFTPFDQVNLNYYEKTCKVLIKYTILYTRPKNKPKFKHDAEMLSELWNSCVEQVKKMKETSLGNSCLSIFKFLTENDENKLSLYSSEENFGINNAERRNSYFEKFPIYSEDIEAQFIKGTERACFLNKSQGLLKNYIFKSLPSDIIRKISEYMKNDDLENFCNNDASTIKH